MCGTVVVEDGTAVLHHRAVAEWLVSDGASSPLRVSLSAARQAMSDAVMTWLAPVISDQQSDDNGTATSAVVVCLMMCACVNMRRLLQRCYHHHHHHHHLCVVGAAVTSHLCHGHGEWLISITSRACCRCRYEADQPICCLVDQDDVFSPDQAGDQVIGRRERGEPDGLEPPLRAWQYGRRLQRDGRQFVRRLTRDRCVTRQSHC